MDLVKILENVPVNTPLYSTVHGTVYYKGINDDQVFLIFCTDCIGRKKTFTRDGKYVEGDGECVLFPAKDDRDWNNFNKKQFKPFKPFDKVLVRDGISDPWELAFFAYVDKPDCTDFRYATLNGAHWRDCIHYEGNEHLLGVVERP